MASGNLGGESLPETVGWDAISAAFAGLYGDQEPVHFSGGFIALGGDFDGISAYRADGHWHMVTYALSELYSKETDDPEWSGMGFEFTMRIPRHGDEPPEWSLRLLGGLCRWVLESGTVLSAGHNVRLTESMEAKGWPRPWPAFALVLDPELGALATPHGRLEFLQVVGLADADLAEIESMTRRQEGNGLQRTVELAMARSGHRLGVSPAILE